MACGAGNMRSNTPQTSYSKPSQGSRHITAAIAFVVTLIIFVMQLSWVNVNIDIGRMSAYMVADGATIRDIWSIMQAAGAVGDFDQHIGDLPNSMDLLNATTDAIVSDTLHFISSISITLENVSVWDILYTGELPGIFDIIQIGDPPDLAAAMQVFENLVTWEVMRVTDGMGTLEQSLSIGEIPNVINMVDMVVEMLVREGPGWGMGPDDIYRLRADTEVLRTAEDAVDLLRMIFIGCAILLAVFVYLLVAGVRGARVFGFISMVIVLLLSGGFALVMFYGNQILADTLGEYMQIGAGWQVYATIGLSVLAFVLIAIHKTPPAYDAYHRIPSKTVEK